MGYALSVPGEISEWLSLSAYLRKIGASSDDVGRAHYERAASLVEDIEIKVRVLSAREDAGFSRLARADGDTATLDYSDAVMRAGLADIRGLSNTGGLKIGDDGLYEALLASHVAPQIAMMIRDYQHLSAQERAAFFTQAVAP